MAGVQHPSEMPERPVAANEAIESHAGIFRRLADEHAQVAALMRQIADEPDEARREELFDEVRRELLAHAHAEQASLYAALRDHASTEELALHSWEEHEEVEGLLDEIDSTDPSDDAWMDLFLQMMSTVEHHVQEEESELFSQATIVLSKDDAYELEDEFTTAKEEELERLS